MTREHFNQHFSIAAGYRGITDFATLALVNNTAYVPSEGSVAAIVLEPRLQVYKAGCLLMCRVLRRLPPAHVEGFVMQVSEKPTQLLTLRAGFHTDCKPAYSGAVDSSLYRPLAVVSLTQ